MMVAISSGFRSAISSMGSFASMMSSHFLHLSDERHGQPSALGDRGKDTTGVSSGTPFFISSQGFSSSLPTNTSFDSECSRMYDTVSSVSVGYTGTVTNPAIIAAMSAMIHHAQFLEQMAILDPGSSSSDLRYAAIFLLSTSVSPNVQYLRLSAPPPMGCVMRRLAACFSHRPRKVLRRVSGLAMSATSFLSLSVVAFAASPPQRFSMTMVEG
mmetsp:Transcript_19459/g.36431  ORF Transcript_19459/g.36431 Transcript_19459/m.36431 type:complete len:213 (-) Transcript_19459:254-892(-)